MHNSFLKREKFFRSGLSDSRDLSTQLSSDLNYLVSLPRHILEFSLILSAVAVGVVEYLLRGPQTSLTTIGIFLATGSRIAPSMLTLQASMGSMKQAIGESTSIRKILAVAPKNLSPKSLSVPIEPTEPSKMKSIAIGIAVHNISVKYLGATEYSLKNVSFTAEAGKKYAIVGLSGAGKSTLVDAILGLVEIANGSIQLNGLPPRKMITLHSGAVAYVPQSPTMIRGTIRENILFGFPHELASEENLKSCIEKAQLQSFLSELPLGLETLVGESGTTLSGGQRQRIGIARALLTNPGLLILDEPTSALDSQTELDLSQMLKSLHGKVTILIVAHRLATISDADKVLFMENGRLAQIGTPEDISRWFPNTGNTSTI